MAVVVLSKALVMLLSWYKTFKKSNIKGNTSTYTVAGDTTFVEITSGMDSGELLKVKLPAGLVASGLLVAPGRLTVAGLGESVPRIYGLISSSYLLQNDP